MYSFGATIYRSALNYIVDVPAEISRELGEGKHVPVRGRVNGKAFFGMMAPRKNGSHVLFLRTEIRQETGTGEGDLVQIEIEFDPENREIPLPEDVEMIFSEDHIVLSTFLNLSPSHRRELLKYILSAKREETRLKRIRHVAMRMIERASGKKGA